MSQKIAQAQTAVPNTTAGSFNPKWRERQMLDSSTLRIPMYNWQQVARLNNQPKIAPNAYKVEMIQGDKAVILNNEDAITLDLPASMINNTVKDFATDYFYVLARYYADIGQLRIQVARMSRFANQDPSNPGMGSVGSWQVHLADFTPHHGAEWQEKMVYRTASEKLQNKPGRNPFAPFKGADNDPLFYNCDMNCMQVAVGAAVKKFQAPVGWVAMVSTDLDVATKTGSSFFRKTTTTTYTGYAKVTWYAALPMTYATQGTTTAICLNAVPNGDGTTSCHPSEPLNIYSGVSLEKWDASGMDDSMNDSKEQVWQRSDSKSSFTIGGLGAIFAIIAVLVIAVFTGGAGLALLAVLGPALSFAVTAAAAFAAYAVANIAFSNGNSIGSPQGTFFGAAGDGVLRPQNGGNEITDSVRNATQQRAMQPNDPTGSLQGIQQHYTDTKPEVSKGQVQNTVLQMQQKIKDCLDQGMSKAEARRCAGRERGDPQPSVIISK